MPSTPAMSQRIKKKTPTRPTTEWASSAFTAATDERSETWEMFFLWPVIGWRRIQQSLKDPESIHTHLARCSATCENVKKKKREKTK